MGCYHKEQKISENYVRYYHLLVLRSFGFLVGKTSSQKFWFFGVFVFGFLVEQHLTAKRWEGFGTAPDSKEMGREMGYGRGRVPYTYIYIWYPPQLSTFSRGG